MCPYYPFIKLFIQKHKLQPVVDVLLFIIIIYFFHWLWWSGGLKSFLNEFAFFTETEGFLAHQIFLPAAWIVEHILHYPIKTLDNTLYFANHGYVAIEKACSGLKQFYEWTVLMILFPGPWKKKLWYIPLGLLVIHLDNIIRIVILSVVVVHWPQHWDFIHMWILRPFFYVVIFALWVVWVEKIRSGGTMRRGDGGAEGRRDKKI
jgi:exosortase/archaeosortase family protein